MRSNEFKIVERHLWILYLAVLCLALSAMCGCNGHTPPVIDPPTGLPEVCLEFKPKYGVGWLDFSPANKWIVVSHWQDVDPAQPGNQKAIEVWQYTEPTVPPVLIWEHVWTGPLDYLSYPGYGEQGPLVVANVKGGDGGSDELIYIDFFNNSYRLVVCRFDSGTERMEIINERLLPTYFTRELVLMDLLACNMSAPRNSRFSDLVVGYRHYGKITKALFCYTAPALNLKWSHWVTEDGTPTGRFNERWSCHRPVVIPWPNGKDCLWRGLAMLDWNGGGQLGDHSYEDYPVEMQDINGGDEYAERHFDSCCYFDTEGVPIIIATEDGPWVWQYPHLSTYVKPDGRKYWEYRWLGSYSKGHTHRLRSLDHRLFILTTVAHSDNSKYRVRCIDRTSMKEQWSRKTWEEAEVIEWDGDHTSKEVLTDYAVLDSKGKVAYKRGGISYYENNPVADLFALGHEQFLESFGNGRIRAIANTEARVNVAVPHDPNSSFY